MRITVMRQVKFCAGHRLAGHEGKCVNLHGHNYVAQFFVTGNKVDACGRVVDFSLINQLFKGWIDENWDHGMLIWEDDTEAIEALKLVKQQRTFVMPYNPTAENMANYLLTKVAPELVAQIKDYDVYVSKVIVWETENSFAEVSVDENSPSSTVAHHGEQGSQREPSEKADQFPDGFKSRTAIV